MSENLGAQVQVQAFADTYTGGLSLLHAAAFALVGPTAWALRGTLWLATLGSMGVVF